MSDQFIQSLNKVTELLKSNNQLREKIEIILKEKDELAKSLFQSNMQNEKLS